MRFYKVNGIDHTVYDDVEELPKDFKYIDWRTASVGDWVKADDGCFIQILRKGKMVVPKGRNKVREYVGTCTGTFPVSSRVTRWPDDRGGSRRSRRPAAAPWRESC